MRQKKLFFAVVKLEKETKGGMKNEVACGNGVSLWREKKFTKCFGSWLKNYPTYAGASLGRVL